MIRCYLKGQQTNWDLNLGCLAAAYRATKHEATKFTPNYLMLGREVRLPYDITLTTKGSPRIEQTMTHYVFDLRGKMQKAYDLTRKNLQRSVTRQRDNYDGKSNFSSYQPGDLVWYLNETRKIGSCPKLQPAFYGPYLILTKISDQSYRIQLDAKGTFRVVHHDKLKRYEGDVSLKWAKSALKRKWKTTKFNQQREGQNSTNNSESDSN